MISAVKVDRPDMLVGQKVRSQLVVNKADIVPDPEASMDLLKDKELIGLKEFGRSKVKSEENLGEQDQKKEALLLVVKDRDMPTASSEMEDLPQCTLALPTRPRTRPPTTRFPRMRTVRRRRLRRLREEGKEEGVDVGVEGRIRKSMRRLEGH